MKLSNFLPSENFAEVKCSSSSPVGKFVKFSNTILYTNIKFESLNYLKLGEKPLRIHKLNYFDVWIVLQNANISPSFFPLSMCQKKEKLFSISFDPSISISWHHDRAEQSGAKWQQKCSKVEETLKMLMWYFLSPLLIWSFKFSTPNGKFFQHFFSLSKAKFFIFMLASLPVKNMHRRNN